MNRLTRPSASQSAPPALLLWRNELGFYLRQPLNAVLLAGLLCYGWLLANNGAGVMPAQLLKQLLFSQSAMLVFLSPFVLTLLAPQAFLRDRLHRMSPFVHSSALSPAGLRQQQRRGLLTLGLVMLLLQNALIGLVLVPQLTDPAAGAVTGRALLVAALASFFLQQLPALLLSALLAERLCQRLHSSLPLYLCAAALWIGYLLLSAATGSPLMAGSAVTSPLLWQLMCWLDPLAVIPLFSALQQQSGPADLLQLATEPVLWQNRLLWAALLAWLYWRRHDQQDVRNQAERRRAPGRFFRPQQPATSDSGLPSAAGSFNVTLLAEADQTTPHRLRQLQTLLQFQLRQILAQPAQLALLAGAALLVFSEVWGNLGYAEQLAQLTPTSRDALNLVCWDLLPPLCTLLLAGWAHQLAWQGRQNRMSELLAATALPATLLYISRLLSLMLLAGLTVLLMLIAVAAVQLLQGQTPALAEYSRQGALLLLPLLGWVCLLQCCHGLLNSPLWANALVLLCLLAAFSPITAWLELNSPLWRLWLSPLGQPDALWGYSASIGRLQRFGPYWLSLMLLCCLAGIGWFHRDSPQWRNQPSAGFRLLLAGGLVLTLWQGFSLQQQWQQDRPAASERYAKRAAYERQYGQWAQRPAPEVQALDWVVTLDPPHQQADVSVQMTLVNSHPQPLTELLLGQLPGSTPLQAPPQVGGARLLHADVALQQYHYQFDAPLQPGASTRASLQIRLQQTALSQVSVPLTLRPQFSLIQALYWLPKPGFVSEFTLRDASLRREYQLPAMPDNLPSRLFADSPAPAATYDFVRLNTTIQLPAGYLAVAQGDAVTAPQRSGLAALATSAQPASEQAQRELAQRELAQQELAQPAAGWQAHQFVSAPLRNLPAVLALPAALYQQLDQQLTDLSDWQGQPLPPVQLQLYTPPAAAEHSASTLGAAADTLRWFSRHVAPYRQAQLRLVIMPELGASGYALPGLILLNHHHGVRARPTADAGFSQHYRRVVHETAHQWFGHDLGNGVPADRVLLVESLSKYVELVLIEQQFGPAAMQALVDWETERWQWAQARSTGQLLALVDADESHDQYSRATLVFARLRAELGDAVITAALRQLWQQHAYPHPPASSMDFVRALRAQSPKDKTALIDQLLLDTNTQQLLRPPAGSEAAERLAEPVP